MSSTVDVNILLYASDASSPLYERAAAHLERLAAGPDLVYVFWPVAMGYLRIATHPAIFGRPLSVESAVGNLDALLSLPHVRTGAEGSGFWPAYKAVARDVSPRGNLVPDAHLAALMREHGVGMIWTRDRDFRQFEGIRALDPFAESI